MNEQLQILSLGHRASARCSCGRWAHVLRERMPHQAERGAALEREHAKHCELAMPRRGREVRQQPN